MMKVKEELQTLENEKSPLLEKLSKLNEILLGVSNPENAKKITILENEKNKLNNDLAKHNSIVQNIKAEKDKLNEKISKITDEEQVKKLFDYLRKTRWFFFENRKMLLFDKWSGMLWTNLNFYSSPTNLNYKSAPNEINKISWHNIDNWRLPTYEELRFMIKDKTFPFQEGDNWRIKSKDYWLLKSGRIYLDSLSQGNSSRRYPFIPCSSKYKTDKFKTGFVNEYINEATELKKNELLISFFIEQDWLPKFEDEEIGQIYKAYIEKQIITSKINKINEQLDKLEKLTKRKTITADFDYQLPLMNYNLDKINNSPLQYFRSSVKWINDLIVGLDDFANDNSEFLFGIQKIQIEMSREYKDIADFTDDENRFFKESYKKFQQIFDFDFDIVKHQLYDFREEAKEQLAILNSISSQKDKIKSLAKIEKQERPDFHLLAEYTGELIQGKLKKFVWYQEKNEKIQLILNKIKEWFEDYQIFIDKTKTDFFKKCEDESIEKDIYTVWFEDWRKAIFLLISKIFILISDSLDPNKLDEKIILGIIEMAENYKEELNNFYIEETLTIYQKFAFQPGGSLQEKFEKEMELSKITNNFTEKLQKIMFENTSSADKIFILRWANVWFDSQIEEIVLFAEKSNLADITPVFTETLEKLQKLKKQNMEVFLNDIKTFSKMVKKRNDDYNSLMFKMRKELMKGA